MTLLQAAVAAAWLYVTPSVCGSEGWGAYDPRWWQLAAGFCVGHGLLLAAVAAALRDPWAPLVWVWPAVLLKPAAAAGAVPPLLALVPAAALLAALAAGGLPVTRRRRVGLSLLFALTGALPWPWLRQAELRAMGKVIASGEVELLLRDLAGQIADDTAAHGLPPADGGRWLRDRLRAPGWQEHDGEWWWAPAAGVRDSAVRLRYLAPSSDSPAAPLLESIAPPRPLATARRFTAVISVDGAISWSWPDGPPPAVAARRAAAPRP
ncbi:MAG: hypothetical protein IT204_14710 [Fimbriimonadaceae bacterium]|nr:hypothetical protein [Fimbriimonadaceae bacterium]